MLFSKLKKQIGSLESRIDRLEEEVRELVLLGNKKTDTQGREISCAELIDEWVNGGEGK
ncbi:MAG: hypothetical protein IJX51_03370 [Clostridia bacterium]|nr:hypothetical protein [Clostridia bacterium]